MSDWFARWKRSSTPYEEGKRGCYQKSRYSTEQVAQEYKTKAEQQRKISLRVYKCEVCSGFHLTKKENFINDDRRSC